MNNWFDVKEKLPQHMEKVLVSVDCPIEYHAFAVCIFVDSDMMEKMLKEEGVTPEHKPDKKYYFCSQENAGNQLNNVKFWHYIVPPPRSIKNEET